MFDRGIYEKGGPGRRKFNNRGLFGALNWAGAWRGADAGVEKQNTPHGAIDRGGAGNLARGPLVQGPWRPRTEHYK